MTLTGKKDCLCDDRVGFVPASYLKMLKRRPVPGDFSKYKHVQRVEGDDKNNTEQDDETSVEEVIAFIYFVAI